MTNVMEYGRHLTHLRAPNPTSTTYSV